MSPLSYYHYENKLISDTMYHLREFWILENRKYCGKVHSKVYRMCHIHSHLDNSCRNEMENNNNALIDSLNSMTQGPSWAADMIQLFRSVPTVMDPEVSTCHHRSLPLSQFRINYKIHFFILSFHLDFTARYSINFD
jgi:hypothetical protein